MAWPTGWTKFDTIILPAIAALSAPLADVPYVITNLPATVYAGARSDGGDLRCSISDGSVEIPLEVVSFNVGAETCELHLLAPMISPGSTNTVRIYYGAASETMPAANSTYGSQAVWAAGSNDNYAAVYHFNETVNNDAGGYKDSTANANHGTGTSMAITAPAAKIGNGAEFDGTADFISMADSASLDATSALTISTWFKGSANGVARRLANKLQDANNHYLYVLEIGSDNKPMVILEHQGHTNYHLHASTTSITQTNWNHIAGTYDGGSSIAAHFLNGIADGSGALSSSYTGNIETSTGALRIGMTRYSSSSYYSSGIHDELRISLSIRSADWLYAEYYQGANQSAPTYGGEQSIGGLSIPVAMNHYRRLRAA